jgi:hypothetical protein
MISPLTQIWDNWGIVRRISRDRTRITISLPKGGTIDAPNAGFSLGECVAFSVNQLTKEVVSVVPREVAEVKKLLASQPILELAISVAPEPISEESGIPEVIKSREMEEILNDYFNNVECEGQETSDGADLGCGEDRDLVPGWEDLTGYEVDDGVGLGFEDRLYDNSGEGWET